MKGGAGAWFSVVKKQQRNKEEHSKLPQLPIPVVASVAENGNIGQNNQKTKNAVKNYEGTASIPKKIKEQNHKRHKNSPVTNYRQRKKQNCKQHLWSSVQRRIYNAQN